MFKVKNKYSMTSFWCFYHRLWPQSSYQCNVSTFNFEQIFISRVWKTSHNVLKIQKLYICFVTKVAKPISFGDLSSHRIEIDCEQMTILWIYYEHINICFSSKFALGIPSVFSSFLPVIWSAIASLFSRDLIFFAVSNRKPN